MALPENWRENTAPLLEVDGKGVQLKSLRPKHQYIMDLLLARPTATYGELARIAGVTPAWFSTVVNSDLFQEKLRQRRAAMDNAYNDRITAKIQDLAEKGLDAMTDCLDDDEVSYKEKHSVARTALEAAGILGKSASVSITNNNNSATVVDNSRTVQVTAIEAARARIMERDRRMVEDQRRYEEAKVIEQVDEKD